nr:tetratricopeptide repeat protein [Paenibacillus plantiphilus]
MQIDCYRRIGDKIRTLACCNHRISIDPNTLSGYYSRALAFYDNDQPSEALRDLKLMIQLNPNNREALSLSGQCYVKLGEIYQAQEVFTRILAINQNDFMANIALLKLKAQEVEKLRRSGMVETVRDLDEELGIMPFRWNVIGSMTSLLSRAWFSLISILVLFVLLYHGFKNIPSMLSDPIADWYVWLYLFLLLFLSFRVYSSLSKEIRRHWKVFQYHR